MLQHLAVYITLGLRTAMTNFETLTLLIPWLALVISVYTFTQQRKLQREANELQRATSELAKRQLEMLERETNDQRRAKLSIVLTGKQGAHLLVLRNVGSALATNVRIESIGQPSLLVRHQIDSMFPLQQLRPGAEVRLSAAIYMESPPKFGVRLLWTDPDGTIGTDDFEILH